LRKFIVYFIKKHFYRFLLSDKLSSTVQLQQIQLLNFYHEAKINDRLPKFENVGFKVFSQFEEDGKLLYIFSILGMGNKTFVDLGSNDGVNSNCANLAIHFNWKGLFVDGDQDVIKIGQNFYKNIPNKWSYKPQFVNSFITTDNVNDIIKKGNIEGEIELLSIDIDGNDYWIWDSLAVIQPKVVIIESQVAFGLKNIVVPYKTNDSLQLSEDYYSGASNLALQKLGIKKGYRLVGTNEYGNNLFFIKNGFAEKELPEIKVEETLKHPFATEKFKYFDAIKHLSYIEN
jgi:hypothetical protein